jgi:hypothetical protein
MNRISIAFLVAPLWVPAATAPLAVFIFPHPGQYYWIIITIIIATIFAYGGTLMLGVPAFLILCAHNHTSFWTAAALGFGVGGLTWMAFIVLFAVSLGNSLTFILHEAANFAGWWPVLPTGALGSIVGATLWLIARPDLGRTD